MRAVRDVTTILGSLALAWTLALLSPGVRVVRADGAVPPSASASDADGPTCEADSAGAGDEVAEVLLHIQRLQIERMAASAGADPSDGGIVVLNNRGYNQGPPDLSLPSAIELEHR